MAQKRANCVFCGMILVQRLAHLQLVSNPEVLMMSCVRLSRFQKMMCCFDCMNVIV